VARIVHGELPVGFRYTPGVGNSAFLEALRDRGVFLGSRCAGCGVTYLPARIFCERCFDELTPAVECGPGGTLESFTVGHVDVDGAPIDPPITLGLVRLDGADTVLVHRLIGIEAPAIGMRVTAILRAERAASILDLDGFAPEGSGG
jgi:uncharacterized OB-fold protein